MKKKPLTQDQCRKFLPQYEDGLGQVVYSTKSPCPGDMLIFVPAVNDRVNQARSYSGAHEYRPMIYVVLARTKRKQIVLLGEEDVYVETDWVQLLSVEDDHMFHAKLFDNILNGYVRLNECGSIGE